MYRYSQLAADEIYMGVESCVACIIKGSSAPTCFCCLNKTTGSNIETTLKVPVELIKAKGTKFVFPINNQYHHHLRACTWSLPYLCFLPLIYLSTLLWIITFYNKYLRMPSSNVLITIWSLFQIVISTLLLLLSLGLDFCPKLLKAIT